MHSDTEPLEFPAIRRALEGECATPYGKEAARSLEPAPSLGIARAFQEAVTAARQGWDAGDGPRLEEQPDIRAAIRQSGRAGASPLSGLALRKIIQVVQTGEYLHRSLARYPALFAGDAGDLTATADLVDRLIWFRAPSLIGGDGVPAFDPTRFDGDEEFSIREGMAIES